MGPHQEYLIYEIEKIYRQAVRWVLSDYNHYSSVLEVHAKITWKANARKQKVYISRITADSMAVAIGVWQGYDVYVYYFVYSYN